MRVKLVAVGRRPPTWAAAGYDEFASRLPPDLKLELVEIPTGRRDEGARLLAHVPDDAHLVALDERGSQWTTRELAARLENWRRAAKPLALMIGGPDGLDDACRARAQESWSLSRLTLPHMLVRVLVAEQLYRAWSLSVGHPYHRD